eukprot:m.306267 g.306267  ORF g.306267 m.306267 type:complete len:323 (+) comp41103_c0_seq1:108-1076(+)
MFIAALLIFELLVTASADKHGGDEGPGEKPEPKEAGPGWTYPTHTGGNSGSSNWGAQFPTCGSGKKQSPVNIRPGIAGLYKEYPYKGKSPFAPRCRPITFQGAYVNGSGGRVRNGRAFNDEHTIRYALPEDVSARITRGVFEANVFRLHHVHVHFGSEDYRGSEHTVDGKQFPAELHFVHYNMKYGNISEAGEKDDGLAVIGVFLEIGTQPNPEIEELDFSTLRYKDQSHNVDTLFLNNLLPCTRDYYSYAGSLTTPPCSENVQWVVMQRPIAVTASQLWELRRTYADESDEADPTPMQNNYRQFQPLNGRKVRFYTSCRRQ